MTGIPNDEDPDDWCGCGGCCPTCHPQCFEYPEDDDAEEG